MKRSGNDEKDGVDEEVCLLNNLQDIIKYNLLHDEHTFLEETLNKLKSHIDELFTKYDPSIILVLIMLEIVPVKQHPISESMKFLPTDDQLKTRTREIENAEKQLSSIMKEYE